MARQYIAAAAVAALLFAWACTAPPDPRTLAAAAASDPGCSARTLVSTGGPFPRDSKTLAIRWTGFTNYELAYDGQVILLDTYFDRGSTFPSLGFTAATRTFGTKSRSCSAVSATLCAPL